jgi:hypothetical protein
MNKLSKILTQEGLLKSAGVYDRLKRLNPRWEANGDHYVLNDRRGRPMGWLYPAGGGMWLGEISTGASVERYDYEEAAEWVQDNG